MKLPIRKPVSKPAPAPKQEPVEDSGAEESLESIGDDTLASPQEESGTQTSSGGEDSFFGLRGYQHIPKKGGISAHSSKTIMLRDGESAVLRAVETEPVALNTHSIKVGPGRQFSKIVCPEMNPKHQGQCPVLDEKNGRHKPGYTGVLSFVDMRTALVKEDGAGNKVYAYDLSDFTYEPPAGDARYEALGEEMADIGTYKKYPRAVKLFWMSSDTCRNLEALGMKLRKTCANCARAEKKDSIIRVKNGQRVCACGSPKPASILDCFIKVTRHGSDKDTTYTFDVSDRFGFQDAPRDEKGQLFKPLVLKDVIPVPSPEEIKRSMYKGSQ